MKKRTAWEETVVRWLPAVFPVLAEHARRLAQGERGVLFLTIDTAEMQRMLSTPGTRTVILDPAWRPAAGFIKNMSDLAGVGPETAGRWAAMINIMDPARDVALFLASSPDADGGWFSRFLVTHDGSVPVH